MKQESGKNSLPENLLEGYIRGILAGKYPGKCKIRAKKERTGYWCRLYALSTLFFLWCGVWDWQILHGTPGEEFFKEFPVSKGIQAKKVTFITPDSTLQASQRLPESVLHVPSVRSKKFLYVRDNQIRFRVQ